MTWQNFTFKGNFHGVSEAHLVGIKDDVPVYLKHCLQLGSGGFADSMDYAVAGVVSCGCVGGDGDSGVVR